ncbi:cupin domain-containing protein, partial [Mycobacterium tuberculosis]|nr:cupin domain-containing protein [Mycobacterium tuberculosis]
GQTHHLRAGDVVLLPHGSPHLMESLVEWGQVLPVAHRFNGTVTEMRAGPAEGALEMLCGEFYFGPHVSLSGDSSAFDTRGRRLAWC